MGRRKAQETLRRRVEAMYPAADGITADEIVNLLRSSYHDYQRAKHQTLIRFVQEALQSIRHDHDDERQNPSRKRRRKIGEGEERLQKSPFTSSDSASESDGDDGTPSELSYDLTKTMLRKSYMGMRTEEKKVKLEAGKGSSNSIVNEGEDETRKQLQLKGGGDVEVKGKDVTMFRDLGGIKQVREELNNVLMPIYHPHVARKLGVRPTSGILLHGPPGCGKTRLAHAIANETGFPFYHISPSELVSGISGESEQNIRDLFSKAYRTAPSIIFIDEIDAIASKRENLTREMEKRIVTQLLTCMDQPDNDNYVLVIGATNRLHDIDPALRRPGRFSREIFIGNPDESSREEILSVLTRNVELKAPIDLLKIAKSTPAFVGADLKAVVGQAGEVAMARIVGERYIMRERPEDYVREPWSQEEVDKAAIKMSDLEEAVKIVQPSTRREGFSPIPDVKWEAVGGLDLLRQEFDEYIIRPIKYPEDYEGYGVDLKTGFLLYGPPGCGKTLIAKAVANAAGASYIHIKGPELLNKYVGESEREVRKMFDQARRCAPCILFFDEVDALTTKRGKEGGWVTERLLNQLLIELDGAEQRRGVFVIGATNRPEVIDPALLRPGRFGRLLYVPLPSPDQRVLILKALARNSRLDASTDLSAVGRLEACENMSGADLALLMNEAAMAAIGEKIASADTTCDTSSTIKPHHFEVALGRVFPSVSDEQKKYYRHLSEKFSPSFHRNVKERNGRERSVGKSVLWARMEKGEGGKTVA